MTVKTFCRCDSISVGPTWSCNLAEAISSWLATSWRYWFARGYVSSWYSSVYDIL